MHNPTVKSQSAFPRGNLFWVWAAVGAAVIVVAVNFPWGGKQFDEPVAKLELAISPSFTGWKTAAVCPEARMETQGASVGGKLFLLGGYYMTSPKYTGTIRCDAYDPFANSWKRVADMPHAVTHAGVAADTRYIWVAGGYPLRPDGWQDFATVSSYIYDTVANTWKSFVPLPIARGAGAMVLLNGSLHFISGVDFNRADRTDHWVINPYAAKPAWLPAAALPAPRNHVAAVALNGKIYLAGGQQGINDSLPVATLFIYDPHTNKWTRGADMPTPRSHNSGAAFVYQNRMVVAGGETTRGRSLTDVIAYDLVGNKWLALPSLPAPRHSPLVQLVEGTIVAADGANPPILEATTWVSVGK